MLNLEKTLFETSWGLKPDRKFLVTMHSELTKLFADIEEQIAQTKIRIMEKFEKEIADKSNAYSCAKAHDKLQQAIKSLSVKTPMKIFHRLNEAHDICNMAVHAINESSKQYTNLIQFGRDSYVQQVREFAK